MSFYSIVPVSRHISYARGQIELVSGFWVYKIARSLSMVFVKRMLPLYTSIQYKFTKPLLSCTCIYGEVKVNQVNG